MSVIAQGASSGGDALRAVAIVLTIVSFGLLMVSVLAARTPARLRPLRDGIRLVLQAGGAAWVAAASGVGIPAPIVFIAFVGGAASGWFQGQSLDVSHRGDQIYVRRSILGAALWAAGLILMQVAAIGNSAAVVDIGQALAWFSAGVTGGVMFGRSERIASARNALASGAVVALLLGGFVVAGSAPEARADHVDVFDTLAVQIDCGPVLSGVGIANERRTFDSSDDGGPQCRTPRAR